ncbi:hypothetical protein RHMOL_Rhmol01G0047400 [Rhododendron molle]|uniref:Uncharacterized protein n=1 Tax=Rhododendron molle TaxID=49168 RepID=A0ACC0Q1D4_RHOML|nr:hypothetical protein RHMOL_Rhmol01G0047400 [Rhododendron molle]
MTILLGNLRLSDLSSSTNSIMKMDAMGVWKKKELLSCNSKIPAISQTALRCHLERKMITWIVAIGNVFSVIPLHVELSNLNSIVQEDIGAQSGIGILAELINLEELDLSWNSLGNGILPSLNKLSNLKILNLARTNLNGSISAEAELENRCNGCLEKDSINFPNGTSLPSWEEDDNMDCCHWECVECYSTTRRVIKLKLNRTRGYWGAEWHLNASILLPFESLHSLDLSQNQLRSFVGNEGMASYIFYMIK